MEGILPYVIVSFAVATLAVLAAGIIGMIRGGDFNRRHGNKLMQWRVILQAAAIALLALLMLIAKD